MAQSAVIMAFRKRLKNRGYMDIQIKRLPRNPRLNYDTWLVCALEPLAGMGVQVEMSESMMYFWR